jgi:hypothetical protein
LAELMSLADYQIPTVQNMSLLQTQLNTIFADIKTRLVDPAVSGAVNTANATPTALLSVATTSNSAVVLDSLVLGRRTGGSAGSSGDCAAYILRALAKNVAGTLTIVAQSTTVIGESQAAWDVAAAVSTTTLQVKVTGAANNNVSWTLNGQKRTL